MPEQLTTLERRVYHYLIDFLSENTYQPSIREIAKEFRIKSTKTVSDLLQSLGTKGYIERDQSRSRGVRIIGFTGSGQTQPVPIFNGVQLIGPTLANEHRAGSLTLDRRFLPSEDVFALRMEGSAMIGRGVLDGDFVMVSPSARATDGDMVAARVGEQTLVRTLNHRGAVILLEPASTDERTIEVGPAQDFAVLGVVCGVFRPLYEAPPVAPMPPMADDQIS